MAYDGVLFSEPPLAAATTSQRAATAAGVEAGMRAPERELLGGILPHATLIK